MNPVATPLGSGVMAELACPKCQGPMRSYEHNRVVVDQCAECRGIFLDRGSSRRCSTRGRLLLFD